MRAVLLAGLLLGGVGGCGKYGAPYPPELVTPKGVGALTAVPSTTGVTFRWESPEENRRGRDLRYLMGYSVQRRKTIIAKSDVVDEHNKYVELAFIPDLYIAALERSREEYRIAGKPSHRASAPSGLKSYEYTDTTVKPGTEYLYRIVAKNEYGEGRADQIVRVRFRGLTSEIRPIQSAQIGEESGLEEDGATGLSNR